MNIHATNTKNKPWEIVYVIKVRGSCSVDIESVRLFRLFGVGQYKQM